MHPISPEEPAAAALIAAIRAGEVDRTRQLLQEHPQLVQARIGDETCARPLMAQVADWPGHFPRGRETVAALIGAGALVNATCLAAHHQETALHMAASSDDLEVLDALLDAGAAIEAPGAVIAGGTPLDDAVAFGQWRAARRLVERGAHAAVWHAAALGLLERVRAHFEGGAPIPAPFPWGGTRPGEAPGEVTVCAWAACLGGQRATTEYLLLRGADLNWIAPWNHTTPLDVAQRGGHVELATWLVGRGARSGGAQPGGAHA